MELKQGAILVATLWSKSVRQRMQLYTKQRTMKSLLTLLYANFFIFYLFLRRVCLQHLLDCYLRAVVDTYVWF